MGHRWTQMRKDAISALKICVHLCSSVADSSSSNRCQSVPHRWQTSSSLAARTFARVDREVAVGHLEDDQGHAGGVVFGEVAGPRAGLAVLAGAELVSDGGEPGGPVVAAGEEHRLDGVVVAV